MALLGAVVGAVFGMALGAVAWTAIAGDASTGAIVLISAFDAVVGAAIGDVVVGQFTDD